MSTAIEPTAEQIAERAYFLFVEQGYAHGHARRHWLDAEAQLRKELNPARFDVVLTAPGDEEILIVRALRNATGWSMPKCKALVDEAPQTVQTDLLEPDAQTLREALSAAGATVELRPAEA